MTPLANPLDVAVGTYGLVNVLTHLLTHIHHFIDANLDIIISDTSNHRIRKLVTSTGIISTIAGTGTDGYTGDNGAATSATMSNPTCITIDGGTTLTHSLIHSLILT